MKGHAKWIEVRSAQGSLLFTLHVFDKNGGSRHREGANGAAHYGPHAEPRNRHNSDGPKDAGITKAQERFLYKILAKRGIKGDAARAHLQRLFDVEYLATVTKHDASATIKRLLADVEANKPVPS